MDLHPALAFLFQIYDTSNPEDPKLNVAKFLQLTDAIFWDTLYSEEKDLSESRKILERIVTRDLYLPLCSLRVPADPSTVSLHPWCSSWKDISFSASLLSDRSNSEQPRAAGTGGACVYGPLTFQ